MKYHLFYLRFCQKLQKKYTLDTKIYTLYKSPSIFRKNKYTCSKEMIGQNRRLI